MTTEGCPYCGEATDVELEDTLYGEDTIHELYFCVPCDRKYWEVYKFSRAEDESGDDCGDRSGTTSSPLCLYCNSPRVTLTDHDDSEDAIYQTFDCECGRLFVLIYDHAESQDEYGEVVAGGEE